MALDISGEPTIQAMKPKIDAEVADNFPWPRAGGIARTGVEQIGMPAAWCPRPARGSSCEATDQINLIVNTFR
jgi:hypothetical protein